MKMILVTGAAGFIGFHTVRALIHQGYHVIGIDNMNDYYDVSLKRARLDILNKYSEFTFYKVDLYDSHELSKVFLKQKIDRICHLAAQAGVRYSIEHPEVYERANIQGSINLFELAVAYQIRQVVAASSSSVYGGNKKIPFSVQDSVEDPISFYAATKRGTELIAYCYSVMHNINVTCLRFFTVYGPWGRPDMAPFKFTKNIIENKVIDVYNYGNMERDFTYITDIVSGVTASLDKKFNYEIFNLGNSNTVRLNYFIECIEKELGKRAVKNLMPMQKGDVPKTCADITKSEQMIGFKPKTNIEEGIKKFIKWYKDYYQVK